MKYVPPIGGASNDAYVDANPGTGIEGSAVPAAAIEHPMREILAVISAADIIPSEANLSQLLAALQALTPQFSDQTGLLSGNGWFSIPLKIAGVKKKVIIQFGSTSVAANNVLTNATLPIAWPTGLLQAAAVWNASAPPSGSIGIGPGTNPLTQVALFNSYSSSAQTARWIAIGW